MYVYTVFLSRQASLTNIKYNFEYIFQIHQTNFLKHSTYFKRGGEWRGKWRGDRGGVTGGRGKEIRWERGKKTRKSKAKTSKQFFFPINMKNYAKGEFEEFEAV